MKLFLFLFSFSLIAQESDYTKVYSSLKEITIFEDMAESSKFKACVKQQGSSLEKEIDDEELDKISKCFLGSVSDKGILALEKDLGLSQLKLVKDKKAPIIRRYLHDRLMKGLYGDYALNQSPEMRRKRSLKIVDQKTFLHLYQNYLVNNIHMTQARYCLKRQAKNSDGKSETRKIVEALEELQGKNTLKGLWAKCDSEIRQTLCTDLEGKGTKLNWNSEDFEKSICALKKRLREYRDALSRVEKGLKAFEDAGESRYAFQVEGVENYTGKNPDEKNIQSLSNLTSYDAYNAFQQENPSYFENQVNEFNQFCNEQALDAKKCAKMINQKDMENFNKLKLSVMTEFNRKKDKLKELDNKDELLNSLEVKLLTDKEKSLLKGLSNPEDIKKQLNIILDNYKVSLVHELNEKLKSKMASNQSLSSSNAVDEIRFGLENQKAAMMGVFQFQNTIAQYNQVREKDTNKILGNYSAPIQAEVSDLNEFLEDKDAHKWVKNESGSFEEKGIIDRPGEDFYNSLFTTGSK